MMIKYGLFDDAASFYERQGYKRVESPWLVSKPISDITKPKGSSSYIVVKDSDDPNKIKSFVASGEQSFLYMINKGYLPPGKYQTITPCMRNDTFDSTHTKYFMKLELIDFRGPKHPYMQDDIRALCQDACDFFNCHDYGAFEKKELSDGTIDINYHGNEVGSYGTRQCDFCCWVYGTGLAEPRFSRLLGIE